MHAPGRAPLIKQFGEGEIVRATRHRRSLALVVLALGEREATAAEQGDLHGRVDHESLTTSLRQGA